MGRSTPVELPNGRSWPRKGDALLHFQDMLHSYSVGAKVSRESDHDDLLTLIHVYDSVLPVGHEGKGRAGIEFFEKGVDLEHPGQTKCFFVVRQDGKRIGFSCPRAIDVAAELTKRKSIETGK